MRRHGLWAGIGCILLGWACNGTPPADTATTIPADTATTEVQTPPNENTMTPTLDNGTAIVAEGQLPAFIAKIADHHDLRQLMVQDLVDCAALEKICGLTALTYLSLTNSDCPALPAAFADLQHLERLHYVMGPDESSIPKPILQLVHLKHLHIEGDGLAKVPADLVVLTDLEGINFGESPIQELPDFLGRLPHLQRITLSLTEGITESAARFTAKYPQIEIVLP
jgi:hypothetical protein